MYCVLIYAYLIGLSSIVPNDSHELAMLLMFFF